MTDQHPLTDKICADILPFYPESEYDFIEMRAAADWQLKQVIEWMRDNLQEHKYSGIGILVDYVIEDFREAMRPQQLHPVREEDN